MRTLLADLGTLCKNLVEIPGTNSQFYQLTQATEVQRKAFELLSLTPESLRM
jgi:hypothetical protein